MSRTKNCCYCQREFDVNIVSSKEHLIPKSFGGTDHPLNIRLACLDCNSSRSNKHYRDWIKELVIERDKLITIGEVGFHALRLTKNRIRNANDMWHFVTINKSKISTPYQFIPGTKMKIILNKKEIPNT